MTSIAKRPTGQRRSKIFAAGDNFEMMRKAAATGQPGAFTSDLSTQEFAAIRSVGFRPVGQVMGSAVFFKPARGWGSRCKAYQHPAWTALHPSRTTRIEKVAGSIPTGGVT